MSAKANKTHTLRTVMSGDWVETFCGRTLYPTKVSMEYDDADGKRFEIAKKSADATCKVCRSEAGLP